jgi:quercetin dioxygenase-like cupin family protein
MKKTSLLIAFGLMTSSYAFAADICSVAPKDSCKVLKETDKIRVIEFTPKKGDKIGVHSHPTMVVYILKAGKTKFTLEDGTSKVTESKVGEVLINPPVTHSQEHLSSARAILVEIKE